MLIVSTLGASWLGMQIVHELGHVCAAWATGGAVTNLVLHPLAISRTDVAPNPRPLVVGWGGPLVGVVLPLTVWGIVRRWHSSCEYLWRFFAAFCCVANGAYIGSGVFFPVGDAHVIRSAGSPAWMLALFGAVTIPVGFVLWNGMGEHFGIGQQARPVKPRHVVAVSAVLCGIIVLELALG